MTTKKRTKSTVIHDSKDQVSITVCAEGIEERVSKMKALETDELYGLINLSLLDAQHKSVFGGKPRKRLYACVFGLFGAV